MKVLIFGGTAEGRRLSEKLGRIGIEVTLSVATPYGARAAQGAGNARVMIGRLDETGMTALLRETVFDYAVDATHPYAASATDTIRAACEAARTRYVRLVRPAGKAQSGILYAPDAFSAAEILAKGSGRALLTVGSKELRHFTRAEHFEERFYARILPMEDSLQNTLALGFPGSHIICMQGPFDKEMNIATLKMTRAAFIVTKDSGDPGGFAAKVEAALELGCGVIVISRPVQEEGRTFAEILRFFGAADDAGERAGADNECAFFPLFIDMRGKRVLVAGGGAVAERRIKILIRFGADITVISPEVTADLNCLCDQGAIRLLRKEYERNDAARIEPFLIIAATDRREVNHSIKDEAQDLNIPVIVSDARAECTCFFPALAESEEYIAALVSKNGDHTGVRDLAPQIRRLLNER